MVTIILKILKCIYLCDTKKKEGCYGYLILLDIIANKIFLYFF